MCASTILLDYVIVRVSLKEVHAVWSGAIHDTASRLHGRRLATAPARVTGDCVGTKVTLASDKDLTHAIIAPMWALEKDVVVKRAFV